MKGVIVLLLRLAALLCTSLALAGQPEPAPVVTTTANRLTATAPDTGRKERIEVYKFRQANGVVSYSDQSPSDGHYELLVFEYCYACDPASPVDWRRTGLYVQDYAATIQAAARAYQVEPALIRALIHAESAFNPQAVSRKGAMGLTQLMPGTARDLGVGDAFLAEQNIFGGVKYLSALLRQYKGNIQLATAAYNAGPGAVDRYKGVPPYAETRAYVERIALLHQRYRDALGSGNRP